MLLALEVDGCSNQTECTHHYNAHGNSNYVCLNIKVFVPQYCSNNYLLILQLQVALDYEMCRDILFLLIQKDFHPLHQRQLHQKMLPGT